MYIYKIHHRKKDLQCNEMRCNLKYSNTFVCLHAPYMEGVYVCTQTQFNSIQYSSIQ